MGQVKVKYSVFGTARHAAVRFTDWHGGMRSIPTVELPWSTIVVFLRGVRVAISARRKDGEPGTVQCSISVNGQEAPGPTDRSEVEGYAACAAVVY